MPGHTGTVMEPQIAAFERIAALHWQGTEQERLGDWLLRAAGVGVDFGEGLAARSSSGSRLAMMRRAFMLSIQHRHSKRSCRQCSYWQSSGHHQSSDRSIQMKSGLVNYSI